MEIRFNPLIAAEADAVRRFLTPGDVQTRVANILNQIDKPCTGEIKHEDRPDVGAETAAPAASAIPLPPSAPSAPPAPFTAAADLFPTAPEAPTAGIPMPPGATVPPVPIVPAAPPAPTAPAAPPSPAGAADLDADGLPWSPEIHSGSKAKNADGRWRQKRNLDSAVLANVTAQLRALMAIPSPTANGAQATATATTAAVPLPPPSAPIETTVSSASPATPPVPVPTPLVPPAVTAVPTAPPPAAPVSSGAPVTFPSVMKRVTEGLAGKKFTEQQVNAALAQVGGGVQIPIAQLAARLDLAQQFDTILAAYG